MGNSKFDVVALGELLIDFTSNGVSEQGNPMMEANPGGAPCNVLSMLQNLGRSTAFIGKVGDDIFGHMLIDVVKKQGINADNLLIDEVYNTTLAFVHTDDKGDRSFSFYRNPGADTMLRMGDFDTEILSNTEILHFGTLSMTDDKIAETTRTSVEMAKKAGALISFDPNYRPLLWKDSNLAKEAMWYGIGQCDILKISDDEILFLTGIEDIDKGIEAILEKCSPKLICASMGSQGSKAFYKGDVIFCEAYKRDDVIETTGAGDTFMACLIDGVLSKGIDNLDNESLMDILNYANAAASIIVTRKGALKVMPKREEVDAIRR